MKKLSCCCFPFILKNNVYITIFLYNINFHSRFGDKQYALHIKESSYTAASGNKNTYMVLTLERLKSDEAKKNSKSTDPTFKTDFPARKLPDFYLALSKIMIECGFQPLEIDEETRRHVFKQLADRGYKPDRRSVEMVDVHNGVKEPEPRNRNKKKLTLNIGKNVGFSKDNNNNNNNNNSDTGRKRKAAAEVDHDLSTTKKTRADGLPLKKRVIRDDDETIFVSDKQMSFLPNSSKGAALDEAKKQVEGVKRQLQTQEMDVVSDLDTESGSPPPIATQNLVDYDDISDNMTAWRTLLSCARMLRGSRPHSRRSRREQTSRRDGALVVKSVRFLLKK